jgi:hypothetical protein
VGFFCFRDKVESILLLALWIGISWLFRGFTLLAAALSFDHLPARGWQVLSGVVIVIGGGVLIISRARFDRDPDPGRHRHRGCHQRVPGSPSAEGLDTQLTDVGTQTYGRVAQGRRCSTAKAEGRPATMYAI